MVGMDDRQYCSVLAVMFDTVRCAAHSHMPVLICIWPGRSVTWPDLSHSRKRPNLHKWRQKLQSAKYGFHRRKETCSVEKWFKNGDGWRQGAESFPVVRTGVDAWWFCTLDNFVALQTLHQIVFELLFTVSHSRALPVVGGSHGSCWQRFTCVKVDCGHGWQRLTFRRLAVNALTFDFDDTRFRSFQS